MKEIPVKEKTALYIHIPFCISKCKYCDFFSITSADSKVLKSYINSLCKEILYRKKIHQISELKTVYIGGGTPSLLSCENIKCLFDFLHENFKFDADAEITIEINPGDINENLLYAYKKCGINRLSCGIQSMNDKALIFASRRASSENNRFVLNLLQKEWKENFSVDLICGLPEETEESFINGLTEVISYHPSHISMYSLTIEEKTPFGKLLQNGKLNYDFDFSDNLWLKARSFLENQGYSQYEVSNFALKGYESCHNLFYWNHKNYLGCGSGATGTVYTESGEGFRWTNSRKVNDYINFWSDFNIDDYEESAFSKIEDLEFVDKASSEFEFFMMGLRKLSGIKKSEYEGIFHKKIPEKILKVFEEWEKNSLCQIINLENDVIYTLGQNGIVFLNKFLEEII